MLAHGFTIPLMVELVRAGLASAQAERVRAGSKTIEVARMRINEAGRRRWRRTCSQRTILRGKQAGVRDGPYESTEAAVRPSKTNCRVGNGGYLAG
jgi:hypothetical protein